MKEMSLSFKKQLFICLFGTIILGAVITLLLNHFWVLSKPTKITVHSILADMSEQELILDSDLIVQGTVKNIGKGKWSNPDKIPGKSNVVQTDITVEIQEILSGKYEKPEVILRIEGGYEEKSNTRFVSDGYPDFKKNEKVVLFLHRDDGNLATNEDYFVLTGALQGKYTLQDNKLKNEMDNEKFDIPVNTLKKQIQTEKANNPNWAEIQAEKQAEIRKNNIELFGE